jgi:hypothetical protein
MNRMGNSARAARRVDYGKIAVTKPIGEIRCQKRESNRKARIAPWNEKPKSITPKSQRKPTKKSPSTEEQGHHAEDRFQGLIGGGNRGIVRTPERSRRRSASCRGSARGSPPFKSRVTGEKARRHTRQAGERGMTGRAIEAALLTWRECAARVSSAAGAARTCQAGRTGCAATHGARRPVSIWRTATRHRCMGGERDRPVSPPVRLLCARYSACVTHCEAPPRRRRLLLPCILAAALVPRMLAVVLLGAAAGEWAPRGRRVRGGSRCPLSPAGRREGARGREEEEAVELAGI